MENLRAEVIGNIRAYINTVTNRTISLEQLDKEYDLLIGGRIPYQKLGFRKLEDFIRSEDTLQLNKNGNKLFVSAKISQKSAHIAEMVARQKPAKKKVHRQRFSKRPTAPRFYHTAKWRPTSNIPSPTKNYNSSKRVQAVSHSQFINKGSSRPLVASKVVIPDHSTYNTRASSTHTSVNQRLVNASTSNQIKEFKKEIKEHITNNPPVNSFEVTTNGTSRTRNVSSVISKNVQSLNNNNHHQEQIIPDLRDKHVNPVANARRRIREKMSEISLERDSGNSSPTGDVMTPSPCETPEFPRTDDPHSDLKAFAELNRLGEVKVVLRQIKEKRHGFWSCVVKVNGKTYKTYPEEIVNPEEAKKYCCSLALDDLIPQYRKRKSLMISSEKDILERIPPMLEKHYHGIWAWQLKLDYCDKYNELLSDDWLKIIDASPNVQISEKSVSGDYILYHCQPGDKGRQRASLGLGSLLVSSVSVPSNTIQFDEEGKLTGLITCGISANEIWCQQMETEESDAFTKMMERLQIYYQEHEQHLVVESVSLAGYYVAKYEDGAYYRVRAVKTTEQGVDCFFIDWGDEICIAKEQLFSLKREYATVQAQAFVCRLVGLEHLYDVSIQTESIVNLYERQVLIEHVGESSGSADDTLPVIMYDIETGQSINEEVIGKLTVELASPTLQKVGVTEVYVSNIEPNGDVYIQIHSKGYEKLQELKQHIEEQITASPPTHILYDVTRTNSKNKLYFFKYKDNNWYRIKLIDWSPPSKGDFAQIYFVDHGHTDVIKVSKETLYPLERLNDVFDNYPHQALRVRIALDQIPANFVELATKAMPSDSPVLLKQVGETADNLPLVELFKRSSDGDLFCINKSIGLNAELSANKEGGRMKFKLGQFSPTDRVPSTGTLKSPPLPKIGPDADFYQVQVPLAVSPYNFFVQPLESKKELHELMAKLQERYVDVQYGSLSVEDVKPGTIYASKHDDGYWYRTNVIRVIHSGSSVSVFYCDFGYYQTLSVKQLIPLDEEFTELPYQALKARLAGIKPIQDKWRVDDCEQFKDMIEKKNFFALIVNLEKDELYPSDMVLKIVLIDTSTDEDIYIDKELVKKGVAAAVED